MDQEIEVWKEIPDHEGRYLISNFGRVISIRPAVFRHKKLIKPAYRWFLSLCFNSSGYYKVGLMTNGKLKTHLVHRLVAASFVPLVEGKTDIDHIDCNKLNNKPENLRWCTRKENTQFAWDNNLFLNAIKKGECNGKAILSENQVLQIKDLLAFKTLKVKTIAEKFGVAANVIYKIKLGVTWRHLV